LINELEESQKNDCWKMSKIASVEKNNKASFFSYVENVSIGTERKRKVICNLICKSGVNFIW